MSKLWSGETRSRSWTSSIRVSRLFPLHGTSLTSDSASTPSRYDHILASDLIYFPSLYPPLLRTLLSLTSVTSERPVPPLVVFSYKVRSLIREIPFWEAFGTFPLPSRSHSADKN